MGMDCEDMQPIHIKEECGGGGQLTQWCRQPISSRLFGLLICLCAGLIVLNIVITVSSRDFREKEIERLLASQICDPVVSERQSQDSGDGSDRTSPQENDTQDGPCPHDWHQSQDSCYYFSNLAKTWQEALKMCQWRNANLVVINTKEEQVYVAKLAMRTRVWIGLTDKDGEWKWVDGTPYASTPKKWAAGQPDEYFGHGLGGGEDCGQLLSSGDWNDEHCSRVYRYICEMKAK